MVRTDNPAITRAIKRAGGLRKLAREIGHPGRFSTIRYQAMRGYLSDELADAIYQRFRISAKQLKESPYQ